MDTTKNERYGTVRYGIRTNETVQHLMVLLTVLYCIITL